MSFFQSSMGVMLHHYHVSVRLGLCVAAVCVAIRGQAADSAWTGATDSLWSTTTNWNPAAPVEGDTALFNGAGSGNTTIDLGSGVTVTTLRFGTADAAAYTIGSGGAGQQRRGQHDRSGDLERVAAPLERRCQQRLGRRCDGQLGDSSVGSLDLQQRL